MRDRVRELGLFQDFQQLQNTWAADNLCYTVISFRSDKCLLGYSYNAEHFHLSIIYSISLIKYNNDTFLKMEISLVGLLLSQYYTFELLNYE